MKKNQRVVIAEDTLEIIDKGFYINKNGEKILINAIQNEAVKNTRLFETHELDSLLNNLKSGENNTEYDASESNCPDHSRDKASSQIAMRHLYSDWQFGIPLHAWYEPV